MSAYEKSVVFFLDILGFTEKIKGNKLSVDEILKIIDKSKFFIDYQTWIKEKSKSNIIVDKDKPFYNYLQVSDSIILSFPVTTPFGLLYATFNILQLQIYLITKHKILLRGACTVGNLYHEGTTIFGEAMIDAVELEKEKAIFPRIIITKEAIFECSKYTIFTDSTLEDEIEENSSYLLKDNDNFYFIDYIGFLAYKEMLQEKEQNIEISEIKRKYIEYLLELKKLLKTGFISAKDKKTTDKYTWLLQRYDRNLQILKKQNTFDNSIIKSLEIHFP